MKNNKIKQNLLMYLLLIWGFISFLILAGEDTPGQPMSDLQFYGSKLGAMASLWLCYRTGQWLNKKGLLPEIKEEEEED